MRLTDEELQQLIYVTDHPVRTCLVELQERRKKRSAGQTEAFRTHQEWWEQANQRIAGLDDDRTHLRACAASAFQAGIEWVKRQPDNPPSK